LIPKFASEVTAMVCGLRNRDASLVVTYGFVAELPNISTGTSRRGIGP
jgi:hypothetical protein